MVMRPKPTGRPLDQRLQKLLKKKKKDKIKDKVKEKLKQKKKTKSTKTGLLSKAGLMPVSTPGGIPKVMSQKTAQKDPPPSKRRPIPGKPKDRMPPELLRPKNPPKKFMPMGGPKPMTPEMRKRLKEMGVIMRAPGGDVAKKIKTSARANKSLMNLARKLKPTGRLSTTDLARAKRMLAGAFGKGKGSKPVFKTGTKEKVKGLTQKKTKVAQPLTPAQKKKLQGMMGMAGKGMRKAFGGKNMRSAAKKMKRIM
jgi:hypothetical protein